MMIEKLTNLKGIEMIVILILMYIETRKKTGNEFEVTETETETENVIETKFATETETETKIEKRIVVDKIETWTRKRILRKTGTVMRALARIGQVPKKRAGYVGPFAAYWVKLQICQFASPSAKFRLTYIVLYQIRNNLQDLKGKRKKRRNEREMKVF